MGERPRDGHCKGDVASGGAQACRSAPSLSRASVVLTIAVTRSALAHWQLWPRCFRRQSGGIQSEVVARMHLLWHPTPACAGY